MDLLKEKIKMNAVVVDEHVLKVDTFLNQKVDIQLMNEIGLHVKDYFEGKNITKVVTIETSGIAPASFIANHLGVELVILKKQTSKVLNEGILAEEVYSFTKGNTYNLCTSSKFFEANETVLLVDDFLANGEAALGASRLLKRLNVGLESIVIIIEKSFQEGRSKLEKAGLPVYSLACIESMCDNKIKFM